ncbi:MAG: MC/SLC25 family protein [archaeon]|nr:MC/SLC25 family protein [archaeon]
MSAIAGASGGLLRTLAECPAEVLKVRRQVDLPRGSLLHGLRDAYTGLQVTALRNVGLVSLFWVFFDRLALFSPSPSHSTSPAFDFAAAAAASTGAWLVVFPLDVIKSLAQSGATLSSPTSTSFSLFGACLQLYRSKGLSAFYAGLTAGLLRSALANGAGMVAYRAMLRAVS